MVKPLSAARPHLLQVELLAWYDRNRRHLPWRAAPGETADPYRVWLSEIMLQQTTVVTVGPYFQRLLERWPTVGGPDAPSVVELVGGWTTALMHSCRCR